MSKNSEKNCKNFGISRKGNKGPPEDGIDVEKSILHRFLAKLRMSKKKKKNRMSKKGSS